MKYLEWLKMLGYISKQDLDNVSIKGRNTDNIHGYRDPRVFRNPKPNDAVNNL